MLAKSRNVVLDYDWTKDQISPGPNRKYRFYPIDRGTYIATHRDQRRILGSEWLNR